MGTNYHDLLYVSKQIDVRHLDCLDPLTAGQLHLDWLACWRLRLWKRPDGSGIRNIPRQLPMAILGDGLMERRRGSLPTSLCAIDGEYGSYAWLLWCLHFVPCKCEEHVSVSRSHFTDLSCLERFGSSLPQPRPTLRH